MFLFFFLLFLSAFRTKASHETSKTVGWTRLPVQKSDIIYKASHVASSQQVLFRLDVFCFQQRKYISFSSLFYTVVFAPLIKTAEQSAVSTAAFSGFGGRVRLVLCNINFMFILFFSLGDYVQDASCLTDGDVFTHFFSFPFLLKKTHHKEGKEEGQEQLWTKGQTEEAHWPYWVMRGRRSQHRAQDKKNKSD